MPDYEAIPIMADRHAHRIDPFPASSQPTPGAVPSPVGTGKNSNGQPAFSSPSVNDAVDDGELTPDEIAALTEAADGGDVEASSLLNALGIAAGVGAGIGGAAYLRSRMKNNKGVAPGDMEGRQFTAGTPEFDAAYPEDPSQYYRGKNYPLVPVQGAADPVQDVVAEFDRSVGPVVYGEDAAAGQRALPAPTRMITDQTGGRFNQQGPAPQKLITDQDRVGLQGLNQRQTPPPAPPLKPRGRTEPTGNSRVGQGLRRAAQAARGIR
jgi:hypothetical protein